MGKLSGVQLRGLIHVIRGKRVMVDSDLARLYGVSTKVLNQAVRRNRTRFPSDFMLVLTAEEANERRSQSVTASFRNPRHPPYAFTEQGVAMLSSVLRGPRAVEANIAIMRAFVRYREALLVNAGLAEKFWQLEGKVDRHDKEIGVIMDVIRRMIKEPRKKKRGEIGFKPSGGDAVP